MYYSYFSQWGTVALNPQPLPPRFISVALNPQPLPPRVLYTPYRIG